jgi:hypothetical protein
VRAGGEGPVHAPPLEGLVQAPDDEKLQRAVKALVDAGGGTVASILLYGSHVQQSSPDRWSAYDFMAIVDSYTRFYESLGAGGHLSRPPRIMAAVSYLLPPNVISFRFGDPDQIPAKCAVVNPWQLHRSLRPRSADHFLKGRVVQKLALVWSRGPDEEEALLSALRMAREGIVRWTRPFLEGEFDLERFAETMLRVSYRGEIRPENPGRVLQVFRSQRQDILAIAGESLAAAEKRGEVVRCGGGYRWARPPGRTVRWVYTLYFARSKARATARWFKYMFTFEGWLDYIIRKIERRAGFKVEVDERERRWPLIFLWPKLFRVLRTVREAGPSPPRNGEGSA